LSAGSQGAWLSLAAQRQAGVQAASSNCYSVSMTLEDIQQAIAKLSLEDRPKLRLWLAKFEAALGDHPPLVWCQRTLSRS